MEALISVIIPVYKTEKTLRNCLESVLSQELEPTEIIVVNDASPDHAAEILREYEGRITVLTHSQNKGLLSARLSGIRAANGKYILFVDSDDELVPGILKKLHDKAEETQADITAFGAKLISYDAAIPRKQIQKIEKTMMPYPGKLIGNAIYQECFEHGSYRWSMWGKLFRRELCQRLLEEIPDDFCLMAEDFSLYSVLASYAQHYESIPLKGYLYLYESGISSCINKISADVLWNRQSPFQALNNVRNFLKRQNAPEEKWNAFHKSEQLILVEYFHRWEKCLEPRNRFSLFHKMIFHYDSYAVMSACCLYFATKKETLLETLTGDLPADDFSEKQIRKVGYAVDLNMTEKTMQGRWYAWEKKIKTENFDAIVLDCVIEETLFWDIIAIRATGALPILWKKDHASVKMETHGLSLWLQENRILSEAAGILCCDETSAEWYRSCGRRAVVREKKTDLNALIHQNVSASQSVKPILQSLEQYVLGYSQYMILPASDGETFVPFYRKLNTLFHKIPAEFRKKLFRTLGKIYDHITGH